MGAVMGRLELAGGAAPAGALPHGSAATDAVGGRVVHQPEDQMTLDSTPMGMRRSVSICRSSSGERPRVVR